jgi:hypothetical protein
MSSLIFTKSYSNLRLYTLIFVSIIGLISALFFEQIPENLKGKAGIIIIIVPFIFIYLYLEVRKMLRYPSDLTIDLEQKSISINSQKSCSFENIAMLIITLKKYDYALYLKDTSGVVLLETGDYYGANMHKKDISKFLEGHTNFHFSYDNS